MPLGLEGVCFLYFPWLVMQPCLNVFLLSLLFLLPNISARGSSMVPYGISEMTAVYGVMSKIFYLLKQTSVKGLCLPWLKCFSALVIQINVISQNCNDQSCNKKHPQGYHNTDKQKSLIEKSYYKSFP